MSTMEKSRRGGSAVPNTSEERRQEPVGRKHPELSKKRRVFARKKTRGEAGGEEVRPRETQGRQGEVSDEGAHVRYVQRSHSSGQRRQRYRPHDTLLRTCSAKGCDVIGLQETKRDGTSEISAFGYRVFFSGDCTMVKGRKGQHGVGLAITEEIVEEAGEDGITIECISARLLMDRISVKSNFVTFVVAYAPTKEAPEGQKAKYLAALNCTVASVPAREYVSVLTDASARRGKRGEGGGEVDSKVLAHMAETSSTKTANYRWVSQKTTSSLF